MRRGCSAGHMAEESEFGQMPSGLRDNRCATHREQEDRGYPRYLSRLATERETFVAKSKRHHPTRRKGRLCGGDRLTCPWRGCHYCLGLED